MVALAYNVRIYAKILNTQEKHVNKIDKTSNKTILHMKIFISGKITGEPVEACVNKFAEAELSMYCRTDREAGAMQSHFCIKFVHIEPPISNRKKRSTVHTYIKENQ